jgi:flagellar basal body-associated protein FliL
MADEATEKQQAAEQAKDAKEGKEATQAGPRSYLPWIIMAAIVPLFAGAGFGLGRLLAGGKATHPAEANAPAKPEYQMALNEAGKAEKTWFYKCEPVVANLNEPGATRYVRMGFTLEMSGQLEAGGGGGGGHGGGGGAAGNPYLTEKQPLIMNWLTIYLSSLSLADVQGEKNLNRVLADVREGLNTKLFGGKSVIVNVYYHENAIQ